MFVFLLSPCIGCNGNVKRDNYFVEVKDSIMVDNRTNLTRKGGENFPIGVTALITSYPNFVSGYANGRILLSDGSSLIYDDKKEKNSDDKLADADLEDMFDTPYPLKPGMKPTYLKDPGRVRNQAFFYKMYGASNKEVESKLTNVNWFGTTMRVTTINGVDTQLRKVAAELANHPSLKAYLTNGGSFNWRPIKNTTRLSPHSFGIAIDVGVAYSDYWLWSYAKASETTKIEYTNRIPLEIVTIFQKHGFIWGGNWYHYDTMHFEYRPEIIAYSIFLNSNTGG